MSTELPRAPASAFIEMATGDPNSTAPHEDTIKNALRRKANDPHASEADRQQARAMLEQLFPHPPPADPRG